MQAQVADAKPVRGKELFHSPCVFPNEATYSLEVYRELRKQLRTGWKLYKMWKREDSENIMNTVFQVARNESQVKYHKWFELGKTTVVVSLLKLLGGIFLNWARVQTMWNVDPTFLFIVVTSIKLFSHKPSKIDLRTTWFMFIVLHQSVKGLTVYFFEHRKLLQHMVPMCPPPESHWVQKVQALLQQVQSKEPYLEPTIENIQSLMQPLTETEEITWTLEQLMPIWEARQWKYLYYLIQTRLSDPAPPSDQGSDPSLDQEPAPPSRPASAPPRQPVSAPPSRPASAPPRQPASALENGEVQVPESLQRPVSYHPNRQRQHQDDESREASLTSFAP